MEIYHCTLQHALQWNESVNVMDVSKQSNAVNVLVHAHPQAAGIANRNGRLALHLALDRGKRTWNEGISKLVEAAPRALMTHDVETRFYPLQLAALNVQDEQDLESLSTVLNLLLACPPVLQYSMHHDPALV